MKVCMDIQAALGQRAGVGRYVRELLFHLGAEKDADELAAFYFDFKRTGLDAAPPGVELRACAWMRACRRWPMRADDRRCALVAARCVQMLDAR